MRLISGRRKCSKSVQAFENRVAALEGSDARLRCHSSLIVGVTFGRIFSFQVPSFRCAAEIVEVVRETVEKSNERAYGENRLLRFYDVLPDSEIEEKVAAAK
jgi:hypothetical protein